MVDHKYAPFVVVGAGIGGLSAAITLAAQGHRVVILEQQPSVGGKMAQFAADGFRWDTGPSVVTMRHVFEQLFGLAGRSLDAYLHLTAVDPLTRYFFPDGSVLDLTRDWPALAQQIERLDPRDVAGYLRFLAYAADLHRITGPVFMYGAPPTIPTFLRVPFTDMLKVDAWSTMEQAIARHVHSPHLRQLLGRFATYVGASPYRAPATLSVIAHVELTGGVWYPRGGIYAIADAMERLALELDVDIRTATPVARIETAGGRIQGVRTADGHTLPARAVIANVDVAAVYRHLLPGSAIPAQVVRRLSEMPTSCSGFVLLLGVRDAFPQLAHHNILFCRDYRREFADIFEHGRPPDDPTVYVAITSKSDPDHAPADCENWFVLVNAPALDGRFDWKRDREAYCNHVLDTLALRGLDVRPHLVTSHIRTPEEIARDTGAWRGALYGISSNSPLNAFRRPHNRSPYVQGLYFVGGTTHPGGGVPMVTLSGMTTARMLLQDLGNA